MIGSLLILSCFVFLLQRDVTLAFSFGGFLFVIELIAYLFLKIWGYKSGQFVSGYLPIIKKNVVSKFAEHGFDPELGWIRKPNTSKIDSGKLYHIDSRGSRANPRHEDWPCLISTYGDSYTFCRECADDETWQWHLAEKIGAHVLNFGVGN